MLTILQAATLYFVIFEIAVSENNISKAFFVGVMPLLVVIGALYANIYNHRLEQAIKANNNA